MRVQVKITKPAAAGLTALLVLLIAASAYSARDLPPPAAPFSLGPVDYLGSLSTPADVKGKPSGFKRFINKTLGLEDDHRRMVTPHGVAVDANGRVLVADTRGRVVHVFDSAGKQYKQLHPPESDPFLSPIAIALDSQGRIYVTDSGRSKIFVFRPDGKFLRTLGALSHNESIFKRCTGLAIDRRDDTLYVVDTVAMRVVALNTGGKVLRRFGQQGTGPVEFNYPTHIAVAGDGTLWVVDSLNFRVQHLDASGKILAVFGGQGDRPGEFDKPKGIAVDAQGRILVVEGRFDRVQAYRPDGEMAFTFGNTGAAPGEFFLPAGIALDPDGKIYVADGQNGRVEIFRMNEPQGGR
jgi:DNA-binding beta-propeller fold protein YncE